MTTDLEEYSLSRAEERHFQAIMDISEGVYEGLDYFPGDKSWRTVFRGMAKLEESFLIRGVPLLA